MNAALAVPLFMSSRDESITEKRLDELLYNWECWHFMSRWKVGRGYPQRAAGNFKTSYMHGLTFDEMCERMDARLAGAVEALVNGLPLAQRAAMHHKHLDAVYRVRGSLEGCYLDARRAIRLGLIRRGIA